MNLIYPKSVNAIPYPKFDEEHIDKKTKNTWVFPDIRESFPDIIYCGEVIISPHMYYVTSGEALRKTEVLIGDIREKIDKYQDNEEVLTLLTDLLISIDEFYSILIEIKGPSKYLEVTKCEDGIFSGNICAKKDPKKKKVT